MATKLTKSNPIVKVSDSLTKSGKIKGKGKKETKTLRLICPHHAINKKGKIKPQIDNDGVGTCTCDLCQRSFRTKLYSHDEIEEIKDTAIELFDQGEFMAVSCDAGEDAIIAFAEAKVAIVNAIKAYERVKGIAQKQERVKNKRGKNKRHNNNESGESLYGSWGTGR